MDRRAEEPWRHTTTSHPKEIVMNSSSTQQDPRRRTDHPRVNAARKALVWLGVIVLAVVPFPWWW
jgi:hypothetical protein